MTKEIRAIACLFHWRLCSLCIDQTYQESKGPASGISKSLRIRVMLGARLQQPRSNSICILERRRETRHVVSTMVTHSCGGLKLIFRESLFLCYSLARSGYCIANILRCSATRVAIEPSLSHSTMSGSCPFAFPDAHSTMHWAFLLQYFVSVLYGSGRALALPLSAWLYRRRRRHAAASVEGRGASTHGERISDGERVEIAYRDQRRIAMFELGVFLRFQGYRGKRYRLRRYLRISSTS